MGLQGEVCLCVCPLMKNTLDFWSPKACDQTREKGRPYSLPSHVFSVFSSPLYPVGTPNPECGVFWFCWCPVGGEVTSMCGVGVYAAWVTGMC